MISEDKKPSQDKLEEESTAFEGDMFLSIWYPSPPNFPTPYLCNRDFGDPAKALKYIMKHFNKQKINQSIQLFPNLDKDFIYSNTFVDPGCFFLLEHFIDKSI